MAYRTKTYIAGDWDNDSDAIEKLYEWKQGKKWSLDFHDAHEMKQARDTSLPCSIKASLKARMDISKVFVLIVGNHTNTITKGSCQFCNSYNSYISWCARGRTVDKRSFVKYECEKAIEAGISIIVLYKSTIAEKNNCPIAVRNLGTHIPMYCKNPHGELCWNYSAIKSALGG